MKHRKPKKNRRGTQRPSSEKPSCGLGVRRTSDSSGWVLVHPPCARERAEDIAEVRQMIELGETQIAVDELHWLLSGCGEFVEAHRLLGGLALQLDNDVPLARGHFGYAYQLGVTALRRAGMPSPLPFRQLANKPFFEAAHGLIWCLHKLDKPILANEIVDTLLKLDPSDPLAVRQMVEELRRGGLPLVDLLSEFPRPTDSSED